MPLAEGEAAAGEGDRGAGGEEAPGPGASEPVRPIVFQALIAALVAGLLTEVVVGVVLLATYRSAYGTTLPGHFWVWVLATGIASGAVFATADVVSRRRVWQGIAAGVLLAPAVLFAARFALEASLAGNPLKALAASLGAFSSERLGGIALFASGAAVVYGPLVVVRRRGLGVLAQVYALLCGTGVWLLALVLAPVSFETLNLTVYVLPLLTRAVVFPPGLLAGERLSRTFLRVVGQEGVAAVRAAPPRASARTAGQRHKAKYLTERGEALLETDPGGAAEALAQAYQAWPSGERALLAARAWVRQDEPYRAIEWLGKMLDAARPGPAALDDPELEILAGLEEFEALRARTPVISAAARVPGLDPRWTLHSFVGCVVAVLLALALTPARNPEVPADVTRQRLRSLLRSDPAAEFATARLLERGTGAAPSDLVGLPWGLLRAGVPAVSAQDHEAAAAWYRMAAEGGHVEAMIHTAQNYAFAGREGLAAEWHLKAAERGEAFAMVKVAQAYRWGRGVPRDPARARTWYLRSAEAGSAQGMFHLAAWLETGREFPPDLDQAILWMERAAAQGFASAQGELQRLRRLRALRDGRGER